MINKKLAQQDIKLLLDIGVKEMTLHFGPRSYWFEFEYLFRHIVLERCINHDLEHNRDFYFLVHNNINNSRLYTKEFKNINSVINYLVKYRNSYFKR